MRQAIRVKFRPLNIENGARFLAAATAVGVATSALLLHALPESAVAHGFVSGIKNYGATLAGLGSVLLVLSESEVQFGDVDRYSTW